MNGQLLKSYFNPNTGVYFIILNYFCLIPIQEFTGMSAYSSYSYDYWSL